MARILIVSSDIVSTQMAGPAIRAWEFAKLLSRQQHQVTLAAPALSDVTSTQFKLAAYRQDSDLKKLADPTELILIQGSSVAVYPSLARQDRIMIVDFYDPYLIELLYRGEKSEAQDKLWQQHLFQLYLSAINIQGKIGDFFMCAHEAQRSYWLGHLSSAGRLNPVTYRHDPNFNRLMAIVPFGLSAQPPVHTKPALKGVLPGIKPEDKVILWGGGIYEWFDPLTLIRAMKEVIAREPRAKLFFMGVQHPNPDVKVSGAAQQAMALASELGLLDQAVFFNPRWTPYQERQNYLLEAEIGVSTHFDSLETRFAYRTRILDYIWAGLPIVTTKGDSLAKVVQNYGLGQVVDYEDVSHLAQALVQLLNQPELKASLRPNFNQAAQQMTWEAVSQPLLNFCANPGKAPDQQYMANPAVAKAIRGVYYHPQSYWGKAWANLRLRGWRAVVKEGKTLLRRRFGLS